ncbi:MAG: hypothetical protein ACOY0T_25625 [Myxococcota bacterium]
MHASNEYRGPERRRHRVYVTRNTEYHFRDQLCVAVRDRRTGSWLPGHLAVQRKLSCGLRVHRNGTALPTWTEPRVGESLYFGDDDERELITSALTAVQRPERQVLGEYPERCTG